MKHFFLIQLLILIFITGCKKVNPVSRTSEGVVPVPPTVGAINVAPTVFAGGDLRVALPADSVILYGTFNDTPTDTVQHTWRKISGPFSYSIEKSQSLTTKVYKLQEGIYEFELTVTDKGGLTGKDTVAVDVYKPLIAPSNGLIFKDLIWIFPWYSTLEVKNINLYSPPLKVFVKRDFDSTWIAVSPHSNSTNTTVYEYFIETRPDGGGIYTYGSLYIFYYGTNASDTPDVKITF